ncbi:hypothetical protein AK812_SmicGene3613 [Symbiodinium microadriaticum]|uniref:Uncharacterized protein n=1 Tax=Symbiodinium microadriaticum TaxID=2951 RepID=A0A1Q9EYQ5_SYMMI|nr:hypothetical protein AK812_SmicGene3613 [Symbiodinium microadriaticum]
MRSILNPINSHTQSASFVRPGLAACPAYAWAALAFGRVQSHLFIAKASAMVPPEAGSIRIHEVKHAANEDEILKAWVRDHKGSATLHSVISRSFCGPTHRHFLCGKGSRFACAEKSLWLRM